MMSKQGGYSDGKGVESAIKDAARRAARADPSLGVDQRIRIEHFHRFLSRIFSEGAGSEWLLKGGTGMLARVPSARSTVDIDLYRQGFTLEEALDDLRRLAAVDLGDRFRFVYSHHEDAIGGQGQPYADGWRVYFNVYIGTASKRLIKVDLAIATETRRRRMEPLQQFTIPERWGRAYAEMAKSVPYCEHFRTVEKAHELVAQFIDPALDGAADSLNWSHTRFEWA